jgi:hypothetical protein
MPQIFTCRTNALACARVLTRDGALGLRFVLAPAPDLKLEAFFAFNGLFGCLEEMTSGLGQDDKNDAPGNYPEGYPEKEAPRSFSKH